MCCVVFLASHLLIWCTLNPGKAKCAPPATLLCRKAGCGVGQLGMWAISCKQPSTQFLWTHDLVIGARRFGRDGGARIQSKVGLANNLGEYTSRSPIHVWPRECFSNAGQQLGRLVWVADESEVSKGERERQLEANCTDRSHCTGTDSGSSTSAVPALALSKPTLTSNTSSQHSHYYSRSGFDSGRRMLICSVGNDHDVQHVDAS